MSDTSSSSGGEGESEEAAGGAAIDATDTHPLRPGAKSDSSHDDNVLWCNTCDELVEVQVAVTIESQSTCPKCHGKLKPIDKTSTVDSSKVRTVVANYKGGSQCHGGCERISLACQFHRISQLYGAPYRSGFISFGT